MNPSIREKRKLTFDQKRISTKSIRQFAQIINDAATELRANNDDVNLLFSLDAVDNSSYESESTTIFEEKSILGTKVSEKITMSLVSFKQPKRIELQLVHSQDNNKGENYIQVSGNDST
jgi:hypothetical protein